MSDILISHNTKIKIQIFADHLPQSLILVGSSGMGKETLLKKIAEEVGGNRWAHRANIIEPLEDKKQISIDQIREIKAGLKLSTDKIRLVILPHAEKLTIEAQNSLLKMLEEPPVMTHFLLATPKLSDMLKTIQSRSVIWLLVKPNNEEIYSYFPNIERKVIEKAILVSARKPGLLFSLLDEGSEHGLIASLDTAREILSSNEFDRMCLVNSLVKDSKGLGELLNAFEIICQSALHNVASKGDEKSTKAWQKRLNYVEKSISQLEKNIQAKLVISKLFLML